MILNIVNEEQFKYQSNDNIDFNEWSNYIYIHTCNVPKETKSLLMPQLSSDLATSIEISSWMLTWATSRMCVPVGRKYHTETQLKIEQLIWSNNIYIQYILNININ